MAKKSGLKVPFLLLGRSCPLQTILLSDLVECDSPLQIAMAVWRTIIVSRGLSHSTQKVLFNNVFFIFLLGKPLDEPGDGAAA